MRETGKLDPVAPTSPQTRPEPNDSEAAQAALLLEGQ